MLILACSLRSPSLEQERNLLKISLEKLTQEFNIETKKGKFPHRFVNKNTLNYIGNKPDFCYYDNINLDKYNKIPVNNWNLKIRIFKISK